jgi:imidazoleglycerol-phosphate dehydratase
MAQRRAVVSRETRETNIMVELSIEGQGNFEISTGLRMFDHLLAQLAQHGIFDLKISATGVDPHHVVEDTAICLGRALSQALGERQGIVRMAHAIVPMDDALVAMAVDIGGRGYAVVETPFARESIADMPADLIRHFLESFALEARLNLHAKVLAGIDDHHKAEALFKALARALDAATKIDERISGRVPSTKEIIERGD